MVTSPIFKTCRPLLLASGSPRRRRFFVELGLDFTVKTADVDESPLAAESPDAFVRRLALAKAATVAAEAPGHVVVGADTAVVRDGVILGKPRHRDDGAAMLASLSDRWHEVWTGFALCGREPFLEEVAAVVTRVCFAPLPAEVIAAYLATGDGDDKAGAYGIQSGAAFMVAEIRGSYTNVVGLPVAQVVAALRAVGVLEVAAAPGI
ncbi:MAG: septum formation protein Maf [Desulfobulbaceae bacterium]|nr:MAG: septum formation protein Maf [Desulfobulbaceae bacterium]